MKHFAIYALYENGSIGYLQALRRTYTAIYGFILSSMCSRGITNDYG